MAKATKEYRHIRQAVALCKMFMNPVQILKSDGAEERGEVARMSSFVGAIAIGDVVKTTLGPKGMDKILLGSGEPGKESVQVTNDGATILKSLGVDNPAAKVLVEIAMVQDAEVGDGTTSVTVLAAELLREAERLVQQRIHPQTVIAGWRLAAAAARHALDASATDVSPDSVEFEAELLKIAKTTLSSKILAQHKDHFAKLAVDAVMRLKGSGNLEAVQLIKKSGSSLTESFLDDGFLLEKRPGMYQPKRIENARILIANTPMDTDKVKVFGSRVRVDSVAKVAELEVAEKQKMKEKVANIVAHNINVFINRYTTLGHDRCIGIGADLIYNYPEQLFADANIMAIEHADFEGIERLALVLGGEIVSTFDSPDRVKLGKCDLIEEVMIGEDRLLRFSGVPLGQACSVVLRASTQQILDEAERSMHDALCVLTTYVRDSKTVPGGGAAEMGMSCAVQREAGRTPGKESLSMEAFARALAQLPTVIAENAGLDAPQLVAELRAAHNQGRADAGLGAAEMGMSCAVQREAGRTPGKESLSMETFARALAQLPTVIAENAGLDAPQLVAELRAAHNQGRADAGLGAAEVGMSCAVQREASRTPGKESLSMEAFARALAQLPTVIAENAGLDAPQLVAELRAAHNQGRADAGLDMERGSVGDMRALGVVESLRVKTAMLTSACEAAEMILRVDDIIRSAPRPRHRDGHC